MKTLADRIGDWSLIKKWSKNGFTLRLYYLDGEKLAYQFKDSRKVIFEGKDYRPSPMHAHDSLECVYGLLGFLCLQEGDTDQEYFKNYTEEQLAWTHSRRCEELNMLVYNWEMEQEKKAEAWRRRNGYSNER